MYGREKTTVTLTQTRKHEMYKDIDSRITYQIHDGESLDKLFDHFKCFCLAIGFHPDSVEKIVMLKDHEEVIEKDED